MTDMATAFAPGGIGNLGPGLDVLGAAVEGPGDMVTVWWSEKPGVTVTDPGDPELPRDPARHTSAIAATEVMRRAVALGWELPVAGIALRLKKGLPLAAGQGGSAASAVAGAVAANTLLGAPLQRDALLDACLVAEATVAGRHLDNIAPALMGGIVLVRSVDPIEVVALPVPDTLRVVLAHPAQRLRTADARAVLPAQIDRATVVYQMAQVASMVAALYAGDLELLGRALDDQIAEPARAPLLPGFWEAKRAALEAGALGASISGAGPTAFALTDGDIAAERVCRAMSEAYTASGIACSVRMTRIDMAGARVVRQ